VAEPWVQRVKTRWVQASRFMNKLAYSFFKALPFLSARSNLYFQISTSIHVWSCLVTSISEWACTTTQTWWRPWKLSSFRGSFVDDLIVGGNFQHHPPIQDLQS
jgi:hypothetical protein